MDTMIPRSRGRQERRLGREPEPQERLEHSAGVPDAGAHSPETGASGSSRHEPDDESLIDDAAAGETEALDRLFRRYASRLLGFLMSRLGNREVAEEVLQDVFLDAWRRAASFDRRRGSFRTWIFLRARSRAVDRLRSRTARVAREGSYGSRAVPRDPTSREIAKATVERALSALTDRQRACVEAAFYDGRSLRQVATALEIPLGTAKSRYLTGMRKLRTRYGPGPG